MPIFKLYSHVIMFYINYLIQFHEHNYCIWIYLFSLIHPLDLNTQCHFKFPLEASKPMYQEWCISLCLAPNSIWHIIGAQRIFTELMNNSQLFYSKQSSLSFLSQEENTSHNDRNIKYKLKWICNLKLIF